MDIEETMGMTVDEDSTVGDMLALMEQAKVYEVSLHFGKADVRFPVGKELLETLHKRSVGDEEAQEVVKKVEDMLKDAPISLGIDKKCKAIDAKMRASLNRLSVGRTHLVPESRLEILFADFEEKKKEWDEEVSRLCDKYDEYLGEMQDTLQKFFDTYAPEQTEVVLRRFRKAAKPVEEFRKKFKMELEMGDIPEDLSIFSTSTQATLREVRKNSLRNQCVDMLKGIMETQVAAISEFYACYSDRVLDRGMTLTQQTLEKFESQIQKSIIDNVVCDPRLLQISEKAKALPSKCTSAGFTYTYIQSILFDIYVYGKNMEIDISWEKSAISEDDLEELYEEM